MLILISNIIFKGVVSSEGGNTAESMIYCSDGSEPVTTTQPARVLFYYEIIEDFLFMPYIYWFKPYEGGSTTPNPGTTPAPACGDPAPADWESRRCDNEMNQAWFQLNWIFQALNEYLIQIYRTLK